MKKKILYIITQSEFGGAQRYIFELVTHLNPEKYEITVAAGSGGDLLDRLKAQNCRIWRLKHLIRPVNPYQDILAYFELKKLINAIKPDILQLNSTKAGIIGSLALKAGCKMLNVKCIYRIGGWVFTEDLPQWKKRLYTKLEKWTAKYKDVIVNNCEAHRQIAIKLGIAHARKIKTIYNGIDLERLKFLSREEAREKLDVRGLKSDESLISTNLSKRQISTNLTTNSTNHESDKLINAKGEWNGERKAMVKGFLAAARNDKNNTKTTQKNGVAFGTNSAITDSATRHINSMAYQNNLSNDTKNPTNNSEALEDSTLQGISRVDAGVGSITNTKILSSRKLSTDKSVVDLEGVAHLGSRRQPRIPLLSRPTTHSLYHNHQTQGIWIGCIANFYKNKGLEYLIKAISNFKFQISNFKCIIIGDGAERENLEKLIHNLKLEDRVFLPGRIPEAYKYLKAFDIFVLASIKEGQPWSILEAMAAELPIIATRIAAIPEMLEHGKSGLLVEPKNPEMIREKIEYLVAHPDRTKKLGQEARKVVIERFGIETMARETERLYN